MADGRRVSLNTYLGNCLEEVVSLAVANLPLNFTRSPRAPKGLISPDFLRIEAPAIFIAVTSTPTRNTFQKKKWRYIHELFSNKQYYSPRPLSINVQLSPPGALQPNDEKILRAFFDVEVRPAYGTLHDAITALTKQYEDSEGVTEKAVQALKRSAAIVNLVDELQSLLAEVIVNPIERNVDLWERVQAHCAAETHRCDSEIRSQENRTTLRAVCFGAVLIPADRLRPFLVAACANRRLAEEDVSRLAQTGVELTATIKGPKPPDYFSSTVRVFGPELLSDIVARIRSSDEAAHIVHDLDDELETADRVRDALRIVQQHNARDFSDRVAREFTIAVNPTNPRRLEILDYALLCAGVSSTEMDRALSTRYSDFSSFNRVQCMISAKCQGRNSYTGAEATKIAERVWRYLTDTTDVATVSVDDATSRVLGSRREALKLLGTEVNPAQLVFETLCDRFRVGKTLVSLPSCIGDMCVAGRVAKVERIYELADIPVRHVKVLSGYKGGYEHKAEELAARGWILRYRRIEGQWNRAPLNLGFVHEGDWDDGYLDLMLRSGWDWQLPLERLVSCRDRSAFLRLLGM